MKFTPVESTNRTPDFAARHWMAANNMTRDQEQSHRLHEPESLHNSIDPITGHDIENLASHPYLEDGNLTIYFESDETRQAYLDTPFDHPVGRLPGRSSEEDDRGG